MGSSYVFVSPSPIVDKGSTESAPGGDQGNPGLPTVAFSSMVLPASGNVGGPASSSSRPQDLSGASLISEDAIPLPPSCSAHFREDFAKSLGAYDLDAADVNFLASHLAYPFSC